MVSGDDRLHVQRIYIPFSAEEWEALTLLAYRECRDPREQVRYLLRIALGLNRNPDEQDKKE